MTSSAVIGEWKPIATAPQDGTLVLVAIRESEQGPAQVDVARWAKPARGHEKCWVSADSAPDCPIIYAEGELAFGCRCRRVCRGQARARSRRRNCRKCLARSKGRESSVRRKQARAFRQKPSPPRGDLRC